MSAVGTPPPLPAPAPGHDAPRGDAPGRRRARRGALGVVERVVGARTVDVARNVAKVVTRRELRARLPLGFKLWSWARGFEAEHAAIYDREGIERGEYLTDFVRDQRLWDVNPIPGVLDDKLVLRYALRGSGLAQPETVALVTQHGVVLDPLGAARQLTGPQLLAWLLEDGGSYISKPQGGSFGTSIERLDVVDGRLLVRRGRKSRPFDAARGFAYTRLIERVVEQHPFWTGLSPYAVNTMRLVTMWTPGDPAPFVGFAVQRMGTEDTVPTDNWTGGGLCAPVDLDTGTLGPARVYRFESAREDRPYHTHPDTGGAIDGQVLPDWARIKEAALTAARCVPFMPYVGWDVAVDASGAPVIIEGNRNTGIKVLQVHRGLLRDPAVRRFYERVGAL